MQSLEFGRGVTPRMLLAAMLATLVSPTSADSQVFYTDRASEYGVDLIWSNDYPVGDLGAGVALEDYDRDGDVDLFLATKAGAPLEVHRNEGTGEGGVVFSDQSSSLNLAADRDVKQVLFADLDNDGWRDLILSIWRPNEFGTGFLDGGLQIYRGQSGGAVPTHQRRSGGLGDGRTPDRYRGRRHRPRRGPRPLRERVEARATRRDQSQSAPAQRW